MLTRLRNAKGKAMGYGGCYRCGATWDYAQPHDTRYSDSGACFPLCEECWSVLTPEQRLPFYAQLMHAWTAEVPGYPEGALESVRKWAAIEEAVLSGL